ncbi:MAG: twin-arginine translocase subunit TatB [Gammaproteobacteria bacterium]|nr:twin-arginine translocase subunit TatB [Gammaproteobacteria bacterium]
MFDVGFSELVVIGLIALIVLGPKRLPEVARTAGKWMGQLRRFINNVKQDLDREIHQDELTELRKLREELNSTRRLMENTSGELLQGFTEVTPAATASNTIHSGETPKLEQAVVTEPAPVKSPRAKRAKKSRPGKKHGGTRTTRSS